MKICTQCGHEVENYVTCCAKCGGETFESICEKCGSRFSGKKCPTCGIPAGQHPVSCPNCSTRTFEKICPTCGQKLSGWEYRKTIAATRSTYNRVYSNYDNPFQNRSSRAGNYILVLFTFLLPVIGLMWAVTLKPRLRPIWRVICGVYVGLLSLVILYWQIISSAGMNPGRLVVNMLAIVLFCLLPAILGIVFGGQQLKQQ